MPLVPSYIKKLERYKPGKSIQEAELESKASNYIKLSSNENPFGPSPLAIEAIKNTYSSLNRYPDANGLALRSKLAKKFNVKTDNVVIGSGSEGIMSSIMRTFLLSDDEIIGSEGSFIGFRVLANASGRKVHWVPMKEKKYNLEKMAEKITDYTKIIYIANPDNPMGTYITKSDFDIFYDYVPDRALIILDEAYYEYAQDQVDYPDSMFYRYDNVITLRTFSKAYGLGGLRLGYGFAHDYLIENLNKVAFPHQLAPGLTSTLSVLENYGYSDYPAGQLRTTSNNLAKFMCAFINNGMYNGIKILNPETISLMKTIHYPDAAYDQGLIWYYKNLNGRTLFGHSGSDKGSVTEMFTSPSDNLGLSLIHI